MRSRGLGVLIGGVIVLLFSYAFGKIQGGFVAWFLFAFLCAIWVYELMTFVVGVRYVETNRKLSATRLSAGQNLRIDVEVQSRGIWPLFWLQVSEDIPERWVFQSQGVDTVLQPMWKRSISLHYTVTQVQRGLYVIGDTTVQTGDLLGLLRRQRTDRRQAEVIVYPRVAPVRGWSGYQPEEMGLRQPTRRRSEESTNVLGVRDYVPGDRLSRIHWPASARRGTLQAKEFELHVSSEILFVPDLAKQSFTGATGQLFELEMTITASLMKAAYDLRRTFGATLHGRKVTTFPSGCNESLFLRCMESLATADANGSTDFAQSLTRIAQEAPMGVTLVVVSPRLDKNVAVAAEMARRRTQVEWFVPLEKAELNAAERQGLAMLQAARVNVHLIPSADQLSSLQRGGVQVANRPTSG